MSIEQKIEQFIKRVIEHHGFAVNDNLACLISDQKPVENEGFFIWVFSQKRNRFETKIEKFHTKSRLQKVKQGLSLSEKEYADIVLPAIVSYLEELKKIGFSNIGKGIDLFKKGKLIKSGPFALCRNPIYASFIVFFAPAIAFFLNSWLILFGVVILYIIFKILIKQENNYLLKAFGNEYIKYKAEVNELIPWPHYLLKKK